MLLNRRSLLLAAGAGLAARRGLADQPTGAVPFLPLWPGTPPGGGGPSEPLDVTAHGAIADIATPGLEVFVPQRPNGAAMLVAAGGGFRRIMMDLEARPAGRWLAARGITAFALRYRLPRENWAAGRLAPLQDAQRALRLIRSQAERYGLTPDRLGVLGFSAGGYLMGLAATRFDDRSYDARDAVDALSARPRVAALLYPIITLEPPYDHTSTRRQIVGGDAGSGLDNGLGLDKILALDTAWSVQTRLGPNDPPVFLAQAEDDPVSDVANSRIMAQACAAAGVPVELHNPATGGHGFGMGRPGTASADWPGWYEGWLRRYGMLG